VLEIEFRELEEILGKKSPINALFVLESDSSVEIRELQQESEDTSALEGHKANGNDDIHRGNDTADDGQQRNDAAPSGDSTSNSVRRSSGTITVVE